MPAWTARVVASCTIASPGGRAGRLSRAVTPDELARIAAYVAARRSGTVVRLWEPDGWDLDADHTDELPVDPRGWEYYYTAPTLLIHAHEDPICPYASAAAYHQRLPALGVRSDLVADPAASHRLTDKTDYYARIPPLFARFFLETLT